MKQKAALDLFDQFYKKTYQEAYGYILAKTADILVISEILNKSYLEFYQKLLHSKECTFDSNRKTLFKIIQRHLKSYYKANDDSDVSENGRLIKKYEALLEEELETDLTELEQSEFLKSKTEQLLPDLAKEPLTKRRAFLLYYLFDFSFEKIAKELNITKEAAGNHVYLLTQKIRKTIQSAEQ